MILLNTSPAQSLAIVSSGDVMGTARRFDDDSYYTSKFVSPRDSKVKVNARFRVLKVAAGVRMFQSDDDPRRFLRIKDGLCDGLVSDDVVN